MKTLTAPLLASIDADVTTDISIKTAGLCTEITIKSTPEVIASACTWALEADRLVWVGELKPLHDKELRSELRMILRNT